MLDHIGIKVSDLAASVAFYAAALQAGGRDNGAPGQRPAYSPSYHTAFGIDLDGHNIEAMLP